MSKMPIEKSKAASIQRMAVLMAFLALSCTIIFPAAAEHYVMEIGSKSNPNAHLFAYDQKFRESTRLQNAPMKMVASKEFTDATRLSTRMDLKMEPNLTQMNIDADFIGIGRIDYLVYNPESDVAAFCDLLNTRDFWSFRSDFGSLDAQARRSERTGLCFN
jgi:hypothetical protein